MKKKNFWDNELCMNTLSWGLKYLKIELVFVCDCLTLTVSVIKLEWFTKPTFRRDLGTNCRTTHIVLCFTVWQGLIVLIKIKVNRKCIAINKGHIIKFHEWFKKLLNYWTFRLCWIGLIKSFSFICPQLLYSFLSLARVFKMHRYALKNYQKFVFVFQCMQIMGNSKARAVYEANVPEGFRRPQADSPLDVFIRAKYG